MKRIASLGLILIFIAGMLPYRAGAYVLSGVKWAQPSTTFYVDIPGGGGLWENGFETAIDRWNAATPYFHFSVVHAYWDPCSNPNGSTVRNGVKFDTVNCGFVFGSSTLAVTHTWMSGGAIIQSGVVFNATKNWSVYNGPYDSGSHAGIHDVARIGVHELGHAIGLEHENTLPSIMVAAIAQGTTILVPQKDDKDGVQVLYGPPLDTFAPAVTITSPTSAPTYSTSAAAVNLGGTASDNVGVTAVVWTNNRGGSGNCTFPGSTPINWSCVNIALSVGANVVTIVASDAGENVGVDAVTITYSPPDTQPPLLTITSPTSSPTLETNFAIMALQGTTSDNVGVSNVTWASDRGSSGNCTVVGNPAFAWFCSDIQMLSGLNTLTVTATDLSGNVASDTLAISVTLLPPPVISGVHSAPTDSGSVLITWTTDTPSDSSVDFGAATAYGQTVVDGPPQSTSHSVTIPGLSANTTYHYRVKSRDGYANLSIGGDFTFTTFSIPNLGGISRTTDGLGPLIAGYARIQPGSGSTTPSGLAIFGYRQDGILVSEAGVPDSPPITSGRIYAEVSSGGTVNTGLAVANPNSASVRMFFDLRDKNGIIFRSGFKDLAPQEHSSSFLDADPYLSGLNFQGTFSFNSTLPVSVIAVRGFQNERTPSEFLMSTMPVIDLSAASLGGTQVIPHFAAGDGFTTQILLVNSTGLTQTGVLEFRDSGAALKVVHIDGTPGSGSGYTISPNGTARFVITAASAGISQGSVRVVPTSGGAAPTPLVLFSYKPAGITVSEASVPVTMGSAFRMYVELSPTSLINSGIAIANSGGTSGTVTLSVTNLDGSPGASRSLTLGASEQIVGFLDALIPELAGQSLQGVLRITTDLSISVVGLRSHHNERSPQPDFLMATTPPSLENALPSSAERFLPQIANGGFTTQVILFSGTSGQVANGILTFSRSDGTPLNLDLH